MVTIRYPHQQGSKSRQNSCQVRPTEIIGSISASRRSLWVRTTVSTVWSAASIQNLNYKLYRKTVCCPPTQSSKVIQKFSISRRVTRRRQFMRYFTSNGTDQCQNGSSKILTPYREQRRTTRIVVAYPRLAFSTTKRANHALISFDEEAQVSQGHTSCRNREN